MQDNHFGNLSRELDEVLDRYLDEVIKESISYKEVRNKLMEDRTINTLSSKFKFIDDYIKEKALTRGFHEYRKHSSQPTNESEGIETSKPTLGEMYKLSAPDFSVVTLNENGLFINDFRVPRVRNEGLTITRLGASLYAVRLEFLSKTIIADNYEENGPKSQRLF